MNREFLPEAVVGITVGLLLAVLTVYRTTKAPSPGLMARGAMMSVLLYAIVAAQVLVRNGMTAVGLVLLLVMVCLPVVGMLLAARSQRVTGTAALVGRSIVSVGLAAAMLIAAGQTLSMLSLVDPRTLVIVLTAVTGLLVAFEGMRAAGRIGSLAVWLLIVPILLALVLGFLLGNVGQAVSPIIRTGGVPIATVVSLMAAFVVIGAADSALAGSHRSVGWSPLKVLGGVFIVVILIVFGMLMFFGGAILAPTVQFFVIPANIDALPGLAGVLLAVLTTLFAAVVASSLNGLLVVGTEPTADAPETVVLATAGDVNRRVFGIGLAAALMLALVNPGMEWVVIATSLAAAAVATATTPRGVLIGLVLAGVSVVALTATGVMVWGLWAVLAIAAVAIVGRVGSGRVTQLPEPTVAESPAVTG